MNTTENKLLQNFLLAFDEINALTATSFYVAQGDENQIADDVLSFLINAYRLGIDHVSEMLDEDIAVDTNLLEKAIYTVIDGKTFEDRIHDHVEAGDLRGLQTLAQSEWHRVYAAAAQDGALQIRSNTGYGIVKTWYTVDDDKVRDTHTYLHKTSVDVDEEFFTYDGDHASAPTQFNKAENNVNCRCWLIYEIDATQV